MLTAEATRRAVETVLREESVAVAEVSVTFLSVQQMRALNRRTFDRDHATDVIAFPLAHREMVVGDVYVCPAVAMRSSKIERVSRCEEELRLIVHGTLHVLGYDHPSDSRRMHSGMWRRQEAYLTKLLPA